MSALKVFEITTTMRYFLQSMTKPAKLYTEIICFNYSAHFELEMLTLVVLHSSGPCISSLERT